MKTLAENIKSARVNAHKTQRQVADAINYSPGAISQYETGRYVPKPDVLQAIADYLKVSVEELTNGEIVVEKKRVKDEFPGLDKRGKIMLRRVWDAVMDYTEK